MTEELAGHIAYVKSLPIEAIVLAKDRAHREVAEKLFDYLYSKQDKYHRVLVREEEHTHPGDKRMIEYTIICRIICAA